MDDPRLYVCPNCGNQQLLFPSDEECEYCDEPVPRRTVPHGGPTGLGEGDKATFCNRAAMLILFSQTCVTLEGLPQEASDTMITGLTSLCDLAGVATEDLAEAMLSLACSKDRDKWLEHMT